MLITRISCIITNSVITSLLIEKKNSTNCVGAVSFGVVSSQHTEMKENPEIGIEQQQQQEQLS